MSFTRMKPLNTPAPAGLLVLSIAIFATHPSIAKVDSATTDSTLVAVTPSAETEPVDSRWDAADDPAIWVHPEDSELSLIIATDKQLGINVYDLSGRRLQHLRDGRINNADLRYGFALGGEVVDIVAASNRSTGGIGVYRVDSDARMLRTVADRLVSSEIDDPYGVCMYRSTRSGDFFVFVTDSQGIVRQLKLETDDSNNVVARIVREIRVGSKAEGCTADDVHAALYVGEEKVGIWRYQAEPNAGNERSLVDSVTSTRLTADIEGMSIYSKDDGSGYLIVSSQGSDSVSMYKREQGNDFIGRFYVGSNDQRGIDEVTETDGLDVTSASLGNNYPDGLLVLQDGSNSMPSENQNFKLVSWQDVAEAMDLEHR